MERYFEPAGNRYVFRKDLRRSVIFGRNDLVQDAPISRIDLLVCRNTLMYFNAETQARILGRFHFALADGGVLFLGKAEMLLSHGQLFAPIDLKRRIFRKVAAAAPRRRRRLRRAGAGAAATDAGRAGPAARRGLRWPARWRRSCVTADGLVALTNRQAEPLFGVSPRDVGRPFRDLDLSYRPVELRAYIEQAQVERRAAAGQRRRVHRGRRRGRCTSRSRSTR